ncbi:MAG: lipase [Thermoleophilia bacterium]|nr:lipase [Thermoleophilia bacterium]
MGNVLGSIIDTALVRGLLLIEHLFPLPARLGAQLPVGPRRAANADPVILVGGFANAPEGWNEWKRSLEADGFRVFVFDPPTVGLGDMEQSAQAVADFIADVRRRTGSAKVDVIGFSEGGVLARMAVARLGSLGSVDRLISLASPHRGIGLRPLFDAISGVGWLRAAMPEALVQLLTGSELLRAIEVQDAQLRLGPKRDPRAPRYASIFSATTDLIVHPASSWLPGAWNIPVASDSGRGAGPSHFGMYHLSDRAYEAARVLLLDGDPRDAVRAGTGDVAAATASLMGRQE